MDINDFYKQARQWKMDKEHRDREDEIKRLQQLEEAWKGASEAIKEAFPISGAKLYETETGMTSSFPLTGGNYQFDLVLPGAEYTPVFDEERSMKGVIRCVANCFVTYSFKLVGFYVWVDGSSTRFDNPFEAFLVCCKTMGFVPENC